MNVNDIGDFGSYNSMMNDGFVNRAKNQANNVSRFEELLRKTASQANQDKVEEIADHEATLSPPHSQLPTPNSLSSSPSSKFAKIDKTDKLYEQCAELEIFLVKTLISSMRSTVQKSGLIEEGYAGKMYEDMLYDEYAKHFAKNANLGMAEMAYLDLTGQRGKIVK